MRDALLPILKFQSPHQLAMVLDSLPMNGISAAERNAVILSLALMLMEAAGIQSEEAGDDRR
jgi:hypothetical protein